MTEIIRIHQALLADRSTGNAESPDSWASEWAFEVPVYDKSWVIAKYSGGDFHAVADRYQSCNPPTTVRDYPPSPRLVANPIRRGRRSGLGGAGSISTRSSSTANLLSNFKPPYPIHLSIGTVANHGSINDAWVLEPDADGGFDVYDISGMSRKYPGRVSA